MNEKTIQIVIFSGKRNDWRQWSKMFLAVAEKRKYRAILETDPDAMDIKSEEMKKMNSHIYNDLLLAVARGCGKSVIFPHLVGFLSSRQNIY